MAFKLELDREALDDTLAAYKDSYEYDIDTEIDDDAYVKVLDKAVEMSEELGEYAMTDVANCQEYEDLMEAWHRFIREFLFEAVDKVFK